MRTGAVCGRGCGAGGCRPGSAPGTKAAQQGTDAPAGQGVGLAVARVCRIIQIADAAAPKEIDVARRVSFAQRGPPPPAGARHDCGSRRRWARRAGRT